MRLQVLKNSKKATRIVKSELADFARSRIHAFSLKLTEKEKATLANLRRDGFAAIKDYWPREKALQMRDQLEAYLAEGQSCDYDNGAYLRFWDRRDYDQGVRRLYHVDRLEKELKNFRSDPFVFNVTRAYYGCSFSSGVLVYQHNTHWNATTRYYHVDVFYREFKAFLYLDDVDEGNGPFTYLQGSHRSLSTRLKKQIVGNPPLEKPTSFHAHELKKLLKQEVKVCGAAGTLILADVRGLHRGSPQITRSRSALVNYMYPHPGEVYLDR